MRCEPSAPACGIAHDQFRRIRHDPSLTRRGKLPAPRAASVVVRRSFTVADGAQGRRKTAPDGGAEATGRGDRAHRRIAATGFPPSARSSMTGGVVELLDAPGSEVEDELVVEYASLTAALAGLFASISVVIGAARLPANELHAGPWFRRRRVRATSPAPRRTGRSKPRRTAHRPFGISTPSVGSGQPQMPPPARPPCSWGRSPPRRPPRPSSKPRAWPRDFGATESASRGPRPQWGKASPPVVLSRLVLPRTPAASGAGGRRRQLATRAPPRLGLVRNPGWTDASWRARQAGCRRARHW